MAAKKLTKKYFFSVEGETEKWYLEWLEALINATEESSCKVSIVSKIYKDPCKMVKYQTFPGKTEIWHLSDYESDDPDHVSQFRETMDNLKKAQNMGKQIKYRFGYSNLTFDLWMILHKVNCNTSMAHRRNYLSYINRAYGENFDEMKKYKREDNFKRCLKQLDLTNVRRAVERAESIMQSNHDNGYTLHQYKGYQYYKENPSLEIWRAVKTILEDCSLI